MSVYVIGRNPNDFMAKHVEHYIQADYSDLNVLKNVISEFNIAYVIPGCNDHSYEICSHLASESYLVNVDDFDTTSTILNKSKFIKPKLNPYFFYEIAPYITSSMDISDGLFFELEKLSIASKVGFQFLHDIDENIGTSGEEYEILFSFDEKNLDKIKKIALKHKVKLNLFAKAIKGKYRTSCKNHHF